MPPGRPRKEPKETVTYPASKRKAPPFKPQRPSQVPRVASTTGSESSGPVANSTPSGAAQAEGKSNGASTGFAPAGGMFRSASATTGKANGKSRNRVIEDDEDEDNEAAEEAEQATVADARSKPTQAGDDISDPESEDDALEDPMTMSRQPRRPPPAPKAASRAPAAPATQRRTTPKPPVRRDPSPMSISSSDHHASDDAAPHSPSADLPPAPSQTDPAIPSIPRPLLLRLMHEHFSSSTMKIDKHAVAVLEKYLDVFLREAIARAKLAKKEDVEVGLASQGEENWLEKADLEKVVAGLVMDF